MKLTAHRASAVMLRLEIFRSEDCCINSSNWLQHVWKIIATLPPFRTLLCPFRFTRSFYKSISTACEALLRPDKAFGAWGVAGCCPLGKEWRCPGGDADEGDRGLVWLILGRGMILMHGRLRSYKAVWLHNLCDFCEEVSLYSQTLPIPKQYGGGPRLSQSELRMRSLFLAPLATIASNLSARSVCIRVSGSLLIPSSPVQCIP